MTEQQFILPVNGMNLDADEGNTPSTQATFLKNVINAVNNLSAGNNGGLSTNALTPYPSISTNFDDADLPRLRSYSIDLSGITYPSVFVSFVRDTEEEVPAVTAMANSAALSAIMVGLGFTDAGASVFTITNTTEICQKIIWRDLNVPFNWFFRSVLFTQTAVGALNGTNICIGAKYDLKLNQMVWFNYNTANRHNIQLYNATSDTYTTVLETPLFDFDYNYRISSINIVIADVDSAEGIQTIDRLLYWTDGNVAPRKINIDTAIANDYWNHTNYLNYRTPDEFMLLVKYPPQVRPDGTLYEDTSTSLDNIDSNSYQFRSNFTFDDGEESTWSQISTLVISRTNDGSTFFTDQFISVTDIDAGSSIVRKINIAYRIGNFGDWRKFTVIDRDTAFSTTTTVITNVFGISPLTFVFQFSNDNAYKIVDQVTVNNLFDNVPKKSFAQEFLSSNILALGNNLGGYDNLEQADIDNCDVALTFPSVFDPNVPDDNQVLKGGGTYQFGIIMYDDANRSSSVQTSENLKLYIPTTMGNAWTGIGAYSLQNIVFNLNGLVFPDWVKKISICRTQNTVVNRALEKGFLQWEVESVLYTDNAGALSGGFGLSPSLTSRKVLISLAGVDKFNSDNYNKTSTVYQYADGDKITLITTDTASGNVFINPTTYGVITKDLMSEDGISLSFDMDDRIYELDNTDSTPFSVGSLVEVWSPSSESTNLFYEITEQFNVDQTTHVYTPDAITLETWDTYFLTRDTYPRNSTGSATFTHIVEHHSFSDTIQDSQGEDIGRVNVVNENAREQWKPAEVRYSYPYVQNTFINGLSTFDSTRKKDYYRQYGGITRMYCEQYNLAIIQEEKAFRSMVNRNLLQSATGDTTITISSDILSDAIEIQGNFGCQNGETFIGRQGQLYWWDLKRGAFVGGSFEAVQDISALYDKEGNAQGIKSYATIQSKGIFNNNSDRASTYKVFVHAGFDPKLNKVLFTNWKKDFRITPSFEPTFVNNEDNWSVLTNDTVGFKTVGYWAGFFSFTPEMYSMVEGHRLGNAMVSFKDGQPYFHNLNTATTYNTFYGTSCDQYLEIVGNKGIQTVKRFMNISVDSKNSSPILTGMAYDGVRVLTSNNQESSIPIASFGQLEGVWASPFYRNISNGYTIFTGEELTGSWVKVKLRRNTALKTQYSELRNIAITMRESPKTFK